MEQQNEMSKSSKDEDKFISSPYHECVKVSSLRIKYGKDYNIKEWMKDPNHLYVGRRGRVFVDKVPFYYEGSIWGNPFKKGDIKDILQKYKDHVIGSELKDKLRELEGKALGCFCNENSECHAKILAELYKTYVKEPNHEKLQNDERKLITNGLARWFAVNKIEFINSKTFRELKFKNAELNKKLCHFPIGTIFKEITLNDYCVVNFNIEGATQHFLDLPGWNYLGHFYPNIDGNKYYEILGYHGFCYIEGTENRRATSTGFVYDKVICHENTKLYSKDTIIKKLNFNIADGVLSGYINNKLIKHQLEIEIVLKVESIPTNYLSESHKNGIITESEFKDALWRRNKFQFDVENPPEIQETIDEMVV